MLGETPGFRRTLLPDPGTAWAASLRPCRWHAHRQPDGPQELKEVRELSGRARRTTLPLNAATQQEGQETDTRRDAHFLVGPMRLRADRQVIPVFARAKGRLGLALAVRGGQHLLRGPGVVIGQEQALPHDRSVQKGPGRISALPRQASGPFPARMVGDVQHLVALWPGLPGGKAPPRRSRCPGTTPRCGHSLLPLLEGLQACGQGLLEAAHLPQTARGADAQDEGTRGPPARPLTPRDGASGTGARASGRIQARGKGHAGRGVLGDSGGHRVPRASVDKRLVRFRGVPCVVDAGALRTVANAMFHALTHGGQSIWQLWGSDDLAFVYGRLERNMAVAGHQERQAARTQLRPCLLGVATRGQGRAVIPTGDGGKKGGGVVEERLAWQGKCLAHLPGQVRCERFSGAVEHGIHLVPNVLTGARRRTAGKEMGERGPWRPGGPPPLGARPDSPLDRREEEGCPDGERAAGRGEVTLQKLHEAEALRHGFQRRDGPRLRGAYGALRFAVGQQTLQ